MAKDYSKEISFQAGEISPLFYGRSETEFYQKGLAVAENVFIDKRGGAIRRGGLRNRSQISNSDNDARIFPIQIHQDRCDQVIISEVLMTIVNPSGRFTGVGTLSNAGFRLGSSSWTVGSTDNNSQAYFRDQVCMLRPEQNNGSKVAYISNGAILAGGTHRVVVQQAEKRRIRIMVGTTGALSTDKLNVITEDEYFEASFSGSAILHTITVESDGDNSEGSNLVYVNMSANSTFTQEGQEAVTPWTEDELSEVQMVRVPISKTLEAFYFLHPREQPVKLTYDYSTDTYNYAGAVTFTSKPSEWGTPSTNWPRTGVYAQGRLWLFATSYERFTGWASKSGSPEDFTTGSGAADSWDFVLEETTQINWAIRVGNRDIMLGTDNGEQIITSEGGVISQLDFDISRQSSYGSNKAQPLQVGGKIFFVSPDGRNIHASNYDWQSDNWLSDDITFAADHINKKGVVRQSWGQHPNDLLVVRLDDGTANVLTYDRTTSTIAWTRYKFDGATILDIAFGTIKGKSRLMAVVKRSINEIEFEIEESDPIYMDSYSSAGHRVASNTVSGLDHLDGETVQVVVDGVVDADKTVSSGSITTTTSGNIIHAGKKIESKIVTLPPDVPQDQIRSWLKRWGKFWVLLNQTASPKVNGDRPPASAESETMEVPEGESVSQYQSIGLGLDRNGQITIEEDTPVEMKVLSIVGELTRETL